MERAIEGLNSALAELRVIEEELRFQHDELLMARRDSDDQRHRYSRLFDFIPDPCFVTDKTGKIRDVNIAAAKLLGVEREKLLGKAIGDIAAEGQRREFQDCLGRLSRLERIEDRPVRLRARRDAHAIDVRLTAEAVRAGKGKVAYLQWIMRSDVVK